MIRKPSSLVLQSHNSDMVNIQYHSNLISVIHEVESINLTKAHHVYLQQTPFWKLFSSILNFQINKDYSRKSDVDVETIIKAFDADTKTFNLGGIKIPIREKEVRIMFGIEDGEELIDIPRKIARPNTEFVSRRFHGLRRIKKQNISDALRTAAQEQTNIGIQDVARLLTLFSLATLFVPNKGHSLSWSYTTLVENLDHMLRYNWSAHILEFLENSLCSGSRDKGVAGCVMMLPYRICEHTTLVQQVHKTAIPRCLVWDLKPLSSALKNKNLKKLSQDQVIHNEDSDDDGSEDDGSEELLISDILKNLKGNIVQAKKTTNGTLKQKTPEHDPFGTVPSAFDTKTISMSDVAKTVPEIVPVTIPESNEGTMPNRVPENIQVKDTQEADPVTSVLASLNHQRIEELEQQIIQKDEKIAALEKQITKKNESLTRLYIDNEYLNLENSKLKTDLASLNVVVELLRVEAVEATVHEVTQKAKASVTSADTKEQQTVDPNEPASMYKRLKAKKRQKKKDPQYTYSGKKKFAKKQKADTQAVESDIIDVELLQLSKHSSDMPKQPSLKQIIANFEQNKYLSNQEKERILKIIDNDGQAATVWVVPHQPLCMITIEDVHNLIANESISNMVIDCHARYLESTQEESVHSTFPKRCLYFSSLCWSFVVFEKNYVALETEIDQKLQLSSTYRLLVFPLNTSGT